MEWIAKIAIKIDYQTPPFTGHITHQQTRLLGIGEDYLRSPMATSPVRALSAWPWPRQYPGTNRASVPYASLAVEVFMMPRDRQKPDFIIKLELFQSELYGNQILTSIVRRMVDIVIASERDLEVEDRLIDFLVEYRHRHRQGDTHQCSCPLWQLVEALRLWRLGRVHTPVPKLIMKCISAAKAAAACKLGFHAMMMESHGSLGFRPAKDVGEARAIEALTTRSTLPKYTHGCSDFRPVRRLDEATPPNVIWGDVWAPSALPDEAEIAILGEFRLEFVNVFDIDAQAYEQYARDNGFYFCTAERHKGRAYLDTMLSFGLVNRS